MSDRLIVTEDLAGEAVRVFLEAAPRTVAFSGGGTPRPAYEALARTSYAWPGVHAFMVDERCVPMDHPDSNFKMVSEALLARVPAVVHPINGATCDADGYEADLRAHFGDVAVPRLDLCFMGIGDDGHTASLFPGRPELEVTDRWAVKVPEPGMPPAHPRVSLTLPVLSAARLAVFLVSGAAKREQVGRLLGGDPSLPAYRVRAERVILIVTPDAVPGSAQGP